MAVCRSEVFYFGDCTVLYCTGIYEKNGFMGRKRVGKS